MPKFYNARDLNFIKTISEEVVDYVIEEAIVLFKMSVGETKTNLYGESLGKVWHAPTTMMAIIDREPNSVKYEGFGADQDQTVEFRFNRNRLRTHTIPKVRDINGVLVPTDAIQNAEKGYPEIGDVILFDKSYYEIQNVVESKLVGGSSEIYNKETNQFEDARMELIASAVMVRRSQVQIEDRVR